MSHGGFSSNNQNLVHPQCVAVGSDLPAVPAITSFQKLNQTVVWTLKDMERELHSYKLCVICSPHWSNIKHEEHQHHHETHSSPFGRLCI